jgi:hypothetical protein
MDLEQESLNIKVNTGLSKDIAESCNKLLNVQKEVNELEEKLKKKKAEETFLSEQDIPNKMQEAGISLLKLNDGSKVEIKPFYAAKIPSTRVDEAFNWLRTNGHGDMIKNNVSLTFGRSQDNEAKALVDELRQKGHNVKQVEKVEPMTLKGFVREQIQSGKQVPTDLFGVYIANKTKITTKED